MITIKLNLNERIHLNSVNFQIFSLAESLGGVESLICHPATMTHASVDENTKKSLVSMIIL